MLSFSLKAKACAAFLFTAFLCAENSTAIDTKKLEAALADAASNVSSTYGILAKNPPITNTDKEKLEANWKDGMTAVIGALRQIKEGVKDLKDEIAGIAIPERFRGVQMWEDYYKTKKAEETKSRQEWDEFINLVAEEEGDASPFRPDRNLSGLMRAYILQRNWGPQLGMFGLCSLTVKLTEHRLVLSHGKAVAEGDRGLPLAGFTLARGETDLMIGECRRIFPSLPDFSYGRMATSDGKLDENKAVGTHFYQSFKHPDIATPDPVYKQVIGGMRGINQVVWGTEYYLKSFYPYKGWDEWLMNLGMHIYQMPGARECIGLAHKVGYFDGAPCRPKEFKRALRDYIEFYQNHVGTSFIPAILLFFAEFKDEIGVLGIDEVVAKAKWEEVEDKIDDWVAKAKLPLRLQQEWGTKIGKTLFSNTALLQDLIFGGGAEAQRAIAAGDERGNGERLRAYIAHCIATAGFDVRKDAETIKALTEGFEENYTEIVSAAVELEKMFDKEVTSYTKDIDTLGRVTYQTSCKPYYKTPEANSDPTIAVALGTKMADRAINAPRDEKSSRAYKRIRLPYEVEVAVDSTKMDLPGDAEERLAGVAARTSISIMLAALVQTHMLTGNDAPVELKDLRITEVNSRHIDLANRQVPFMDWKEVIRVSLASYDSLVEDLAQKNAQAAAETAMTNTPEKDQEKKNAIGRKAKDDYMLAFRTDAKKKKEVGDELRSQYQTWTAQAATQLRELDKAETFVKSEAHKHATPGLSGSLNIPKEYNEEFDPRRAAAINESLFKTWRPTIMGEYLRVIDRPGQELPRVGTKEYADELDRIERQMTPDKFRSLLDWYAGIGIKNIMGDQSLEPTRMGRPIMPGAVTGAPVMGWEEVKILRTNMVVATRLLNHVKDNYSNKLQYIEYARKVIWFKFPILRLNHIWKSYQTGDWPKAITAIYDNSVNEINTLFKTNAKDTLVRTYRNAPLWNYILRLHPNLKQPLCEFTRSYEEWKRLNKRIFEGIIGVCAVLSLIPPLTPVFGPITLGLSILYLADEAYDIWVIQAGQMANLEATTYGGASQMEYEDYELGQYLELEMSVEFTTRVVAFCFKAALVAVTAGVTFRPLSAGIKTMWTNYRTARVAALAKIDKAAALNGGKNSTWGIIGEGLPKIMTYTFSGITKVLDATVFRLLRFVGLIERSPHRNLMRTLFNQAGLPRAEGAMQMGMTDYLWVRFENLGLPWLGHRIGTGVVGRVAIGGLLYTGIRHVMHQQKLAAEIATEETLVRLNQGRHKPLRDSALRGKYRYSEVVLMAEIDDLSGQPFLESFNGITDREKASQNADERKAYLAEMKKIQADYQKEIAKRMKENGFDPNETFDLLFTSRHMRLTIERLEKNR